MEKFAELNGWNITFERLDSWVAGCFAKFYYGSSTNFIFGKDGPDEGAWIMTVANPQWSSIERGTDYEMNYTFDGRRTCKVLQWGFENVMASKVLKEELINDFARSSVLEIRHGNRRIEQFALRGTLAATNAVKECHRIRVQKSDPFAN